MEYSLSTKNFSIKRVIKTVAIIIGLFLLALILFLMILFVLIRLDEKGTREAVCKGAINEEECLN